MKKEERLASVMDKINDERIAEAVKTMGAASRRRKLRVRAAAGICAVCVLTVGVIGILGQMNSFAVYEAEYPVMAPYPNERDPLTGAQQVDAWAADKGALRKSRFEGYRDGLMDFTCASLPLLIGDSDENRVCSPINIYLALSALAGMTDGESRAQILDLLGNEDYALQKKTANALWQNNYCSDGAATLILANSVWLDERTEFRSETLESLADDYYASSYRGSFNDPKFISAMKDWLNKQTGGLLKDSVETIEPDPETLLTLLSTVYFRGKWQSEFKVENTEEGIFHAPTGDVTVSYMKKEVDRRYYWSDSFAAVALDIESFGVMWFFLPDEDKTVDDVLADPGMTALLNGSSVYDNSKYLIVDMSIPRFDVSSDTDLADTLKVLGVTDVFDSATADFTPLIADAALEAETELASARHAARVAIDEEGITAASYVELSVCGAAEPPDERVEFKADRPFVFVITGEDGAPLFAGTVNQP